MRLITNKQMEILECINRFGVITLKQLADVLKSRVSHVTVYKSRDKLLELGFIGMEKISYDTVIYIKPSGVDYLDSDLSKFTVLGYAMLEHQLLTNDSIIALMRFAEKKDKKYSFLTEREVRGKYIDENIPIGERRNTKLLKDVPNRVPDFVFSMDNKVGAYEVELNRKSAKRYAQKFMRYQDEVLNKKYDFIFYICGNDEIRSTVERNAKDNDFPYEYLQIDLLGRLLKIGEQKKG